MKRAYYACVKDNDDDGGVSVIAHNIIEARRMARSTDFIMNSLDEFIDLRVNWQKDIKEEQIKDLQYGEVEMIEGLKLGIYGWCEEYCKKCRHDQRIDQDEHICDKCGYDFFS